MKTLLRFLTTACLALLPAVALGQISPGQLQPQFLNVLDNGNFNITQRGTTTAGTITTSPTYLWDRWAGYAGTATQITISTITSGVPAGFTNAAQVSRDNAQVGILPVYLVQEVLTADTKPLAGQTVTLSFWAKSGALFSAASSNLTVKIATGTGTDEGLAALISGWAGAATPLNTLQPITTSWQRYSVSATIGATATELAVQIGWVPVGTAGATDFIQVTGVQLELGQIASNFEWRAASLELAKVQYFLKTFIDGAATRRYGTCQVITANTTAVCGVPLTRTMRAAPTVTVTTAASFGLTSATGTALTCTNLAATATAQTIDRISLTCTTAGSVAITVPTEFIGQATGAAIIASAEL